MPHSKGGYLAWDLGTVTGSFYDEDGFLGLTPDAYGEERSGVEPYESHLPHGVFARPHDPDRGADGAPGRGCTLLQAMEGGRGHAFMCSDPRVVERLPQVSKGSGGIYGGPLNKDPSFGVFDGDSGAFTLAVGYAHGADGKPTKTCLIAIDNRTPGQEAVTIRHGDGMSITMLAGGKNSTVIKNKGGDAYLEVNDDGIVQNGATQVNGGMVVGALPAATPVATSPAVIATFNALIAGLNSVAASAGLTAPASVAAAQIASQAATAAMAKIPAQNLSAT